MAAPSATRLLAMSAPIPFDAPVIAATLFVERSEADAEILVSRAVLSQTPRIFDLGRQPSGQSYSSKRTRTAKRGPAFKPRYDP
jgi:hypothetical protein